MHCLFLVEIFCSVEIIMRNSSRFLLFICYALFGLGVASCTQVPRSSEQGHTEQSLLLDNGNYKVPGILTTPKAATAKLPVIVMLHGTASQKNEVGGLYQRLAALLAQRGYASLRIDFAGTGDSPVDYRLYTLSSAQQDATAALNYLAAHQAFDAKRMALIGFSQGGLIAQLVAAKDARIKALVTWSSTAGDGVGVYQSFVFDRYYAEAQRNGYAAVQFPFLDKPLNFSLQWFTEIQHNSSLTGMSRYHGKLLAVAGMADELVPYVSSINLVAAASAAPATVYLIKGADHLFNVLDPSTTTGFAKDQSKAEELLNTTVNWLARQL
jgi:dienelactone hydrolase